MEWFVYAAVATIVLTPTRSVAVHQPLLLFLGLLSTLILPVAVGVAILKYRLYDIEVVIKKTLLALVLTILIGVPAVLTLAVASQVLLWRGTGKAVTLVGGVLLGLCVVPLIRVARRVADRVVYGRRATAYEVMANFSERVGETYATDDVLSRMAEISMAGTGATTATVWLLVDGVLRPAATAGGDEVATGPDGDAGTFRVEVRHHDELLGALSVTMPANDPLEPGREKLVRDLASQAGLVLRNVRLIEELKASRQRLVAAQDEERRKLERNLHDGAQQQLVALAVKQRLLGALIGAMTARPKRWSPSSPMTRTMHWRTSGTWLAASIHPCWRTRAWLPRWKHRLARRRCPRPSKASASAASARTSRPPSTSRASKPCRTSRSTRMPPALGSRYRTAAAR